MIISVIARVQCTADSRGASYKSPPRQNYSQPLNDDLVIIHRVGKDRRAQVRHSAFALGFFLTKDIKYFTLYLILTSLLVR